MRKTKARKRVLLPDPVYNDPMVTRFVNNLMWNGKKTLAYSIFYDSMNIIAGKLKEDPIPVWKKAVDNVTPQVEVRSRRIGGANFQIPMPIREERKVSMAMKFLIKYARERKDKSMAEKLANEILAAYKEEGGAFKKKEDIHRMAEANKAFSHFKF